MRQDTGKEFRKGYVEYFQLQKRDSIHIYIYINIYKVESPRFGIGTFSICDL